MNAAYKIVSHEAPTQKGNLVAREKGPGSCHTIIHSLNVNLCENANTNVVGGYVISFIETDIMFVYGSLLLFLFS